MGYQRPWIRDRTGIRERHYVDKGVATSDLAVEAAKKALSEAVSRRLIWSDLVATVTPDIFFRPPRAGCSTSWGAKNVWGFDSVGGMLGVRLRFATGAQFVATRSAR